MIHMTCSGCGAKLKGPDDAAGRKTKCPRCGTILTVEEPVYEAEAVPDEGLEDNDPYGLADELPGAQKPAPAAAEPGGGPRRPCPMCGEMILTTAAKCRYCGEIFDPKLKAAAARSRGRGRGAGPDPDDMSTGDWVVALLCSGIGCIAGLIWMIQGKPKGAKMLGVSFLAGIFWNVVGFILRSMNEQPGMP